MGKNVIKGNADGFKVQEDLFNEIINGFQRGEVSAKKKVIKLSPIQRRRVPKVAEAFFQNEQSKPFLKTWVEGMTISSDVDNLIKRVIKVKEEQEEEEEQAEEELEESDVIEDNRISFRLLKTFKVAKLVQCLSGIMLSIESITTFNEDILTPMVEKMTKVDDIKGLTPQMKQILLMNDFKNFIKGFTMPLIPQLFSSIKAYYDSSEIQKLFKEFEEWLSTKIKTEGAISAGIWAIGALMSKLTGGGSLLAAKSATAAQWARVTLQLGKLGYAGYKLYKTREAIVDFFDFDDLDAVKWQANVAKFRDEKIKPFVDTVENELNVIKNNIDTIEIHSVDYLESELKNFTDVNAILTQFKHDQKQVQKLFKFSSGALNTDFKKGLYKTHTITIERTENIDITNGENFIEFVEGVNDLTENIRKSLNNRFNIFVSDESLDLMRDEENGFKFYSKFRELKSLIENYFIVIYQNIDVFCEAIDTNYAEIIEKKVSDKKYKKVIEVLNSISFSKYPDFTGIDGVDKKLIEHVQKDFSSGKYTTYDVSDRLPYHLQKEAIKQGEVQENKGGYWSLSQNTLQPFVPIFSGGAFVGFEVKLIAPNNAEVDLKVPRIYDVLKKISEGEDPWMWSDDGSAGWVFDVGMESFATFGYLGSKSVEKHSVFNTDGFSRMFETYKNYAGIFAQLTSNKDIINDEFIIEEKTNDIVTEIFNLMTTKIYHEE